MRRHEGTATETLSRVVHAIDHPARRAIVDRLVDGEADVAELADLVWDGFRLGQSSTSNHLRVLREADLVAVSVRYGERYCVLCPASLSELMRWVSRCVGPV
ncbi:hypothetical protein GCM10023201_22330 [Actinomycetospora corticicola]|uniref:DNA-binding transcriptional ArsR family regulator n=1 Tax=Actinomycetospora corticicola TaxID=663602 RepID=A0A7Y9DR86_9PSEU|nr:helix-turn-helix domain-containing protein [Actinomycetospora corticicola]NYD34047.1 DNA-binding transcriptional ArsR family regulator [Actinomycetospora corticicola]